MNYYEHHIGDFDQATAHLTACEDGIYSRLIRRYYATEKPLPAEVSAVQRLVRARTKEEKEAVGNMLNEFFQLRADGWHQQRCDEVIASYNAGEPERQARKANEENRVKRHREERAELFKRLTAAGQHAPWNIGMNELRALVARLVTPPATEPVTQPVTAPVTPATATQAPTTSPQSPSTSEKASSSLRDSATTSVLSLVPEEQNQNPTPGTSASTRGTRFSLERLSLAERTEWLAFCGRERPDLDASKTLESFADWWKAKAGKDGVKLDWFATWRNWVRNEKRRPGNAAGLQDGAAEYLRQQEKEISGERLG